MSQPIALLVRPIGVRRLRLVVASGLIALSGCSDPTQESATLDEPAPLAQKSATSDPAPVSTEPAQRSSPAAPGTRVRVPTHCGVLSVTVNGILWLADPPLGGHNPPLGWDDNEAFGHFVVLGHGQGEFFGDEGQRATFRRAAAGAENPNAGCE